MTAKRSFSMMAAKRSMSCERTYLRVRDDSSLCAGARASVFSFCGMTNGAAFPEERIVQRAETSSPEKVQAKPDFGQSSGRTLKTVVEKEKRAGGIKPARSICEAARLWKLESKASAEFAHKRTRCKRAARVDESFWC